ncbi:hypothetical protein ABB37_00959 [Leptomonas pyrrhocoris]|uniref:Uncharacterized protein n=1 Tax=Leptomonas pyrrhocoris TaxID=157538 RepID=A0A0M9GBD0_LEPPY|nr:hypothetical protein ABB37_00959 [Leptomonas pyrrhocoris]XP_015665369.1 hypothetical protein ABB37_00959 [Leptomonas pyrrhocoris]KPA86929.1 hypothetical protein ABB37_00959 [Leptomonas pyrrhocoris]KPA86930.1 hypothetical protein ABB37_00959 [Leptomonas pyrrhocoris]|eukprot:XP_015665368.1 hypothetical protein ABB37_00959 [Leptomonas pyrrhocoris]
MPSNNTDPAPAATGSKVLTLSDEERMGREADERWANRPRPVRRIGGNPELEFKTEVMCRLPNGGVADCARAQLEQNRLRREEEARVKAAEQQRQEQQQPKSPDEL